MSRIESVTDNQNTPENPNATTKTKRLFFTGAVIPMLVPLTIGPFRVMQNRSHIGFNGFCFRSVIFGIRNSFPSAVPASCARNTTLSTKEQISSVTKNELYTAGVIAMIDTLVGGGFSNLARLCQYNPSIPRFPWHSGYLYCWWSASRAVIFPRLISNTLNASGYVLAKPKVSAFISEQTGLKENSRAVSVISSVLTGIFVGLSTNIPNIAAKLPLSQATFSNGKLSVPKTFPTLKAFWLTQGTGPLFFRGVLANGAIAATAFLTIDLVTSLAWYLFPDQTNSDVIPECSSQLFALKAGSPVDHTPEPKDLHDNFYC